jgi:hypothetical protein
VAETDTSQARYIDVRSQYACVAVVSNSISSIDQKVRLSQADFRDSQIRCYERSMDRTSKSNGDKHSASASATTATALPGQKLATSKTPRMLTPSEIDLLREDLKAALSHPMPPVSR